MLFLSIVRNKKRFDEELRLKEELRRQEEIRVSQKTSQESTQPSSSKHVSYTERESENGSLTDNQVKTTDATQIIEL
jgi:C4-dicarboxylate-specific signal transduction histidine kinase